MNIKTKNTCNNQFTQVNKHSRFLRPFVDIKKGISDKKGPLPPMKKLKFEMTKVYMGIPHPMEDFIFQMQYPPLPVAFQSQTLYVDSNLYPPCIALISSLLNSVLGMPSDYRNRSSAQSRISRYFIS